MGHTLHDEHLAGELAWTVRLIGVACAALREDQPSVGNVDLAYTVDKALRVVQANAVAFRRGKERPQNDLRDAWLPTSPLGRSKSSYINAVSLKAAQIGSKRRMEEVRRLLGK